MAIFAVTGDNDLKVYEKGGTYYLLDEAETGGSDESGEGETGEDGTKPTYTELTLLSSNDFGMETDDNKITSHVQLGDISTTEITQQVTTSEAKSGQTVTLTANVATKNTDAAVSGTVEFSIVNTATGVTVGGSGTIKNGTATFEWTPSEPGVYAITASYQGNDQLQVSTGTTTYYAYGENQEGYELTAPESPKYGDNLTFEAKQWTIAEDGENTEPVSDVNFAAYTYNSETDKYDSLVEVWENGDILTPGTYRIAATQGAVEIASKQITVAKRQLTVSVPKIDPIDIEKLEDFNWDAQTLVFENLFNNDEAYKAIFELNADEVKAATAAGSYPLSVIADTTDDAYNDMTEKYLPTMQNGSVRVTVGQVTVNYSVVNDEGGNLVVHEQTGVTQLKDGASIPAGTDVTFTANPAEGYQISSWTINGKVWPAGKDGVVGGVSVDWENHNQLRVENLRSNINVSVQFGSGNRKVDFGVEGGNGSLTAKYHDVAATSPITVVDGSTVVFTATPEEDYMVSHWTVNGEEYKNEDGAVYRENTLQLDNITADTTVCVVFEEHKTYEVTFTAGENGTIAATAGDNTSITSEDTVNKGTAVTFTAAPAEDNMVAQWTVNDKPVTRESMTELGVVVVMDHPLSNTLKVSSVEADLTVHVTFETVQTFAIPTSEEGEYIIEDVEITPKTEDNVVRKGGDVTFTVKPAEDKAITEIKVPGNGKATANADGSWTVTIENVQAEIELTVETVDSILLTIETPQNGKITVTRDGQTLADGALLWAGNELVIKAQANSGYRLDTLTVNDKDITSGDTFTVPEDAKAVTVTATFEQQSSGGGGGGAGGGGGGGVPAEPDEPEVTVDGAGGKAEVEDGTVIITPDEGYEIGTVTVNGEPVEVPADGKLTGLDEDDEVVVTFQPVSDEPGSNPFADVADDAWYADAVQYVYEKGMMNGVSETSFAPNNTTTRAMIVTMLYRLEDEPDAAASAFTDVAAGSYYADAVAWAAANGIVDGVSETAFAPDNAITREQMAAILYRYASFKGYDVSTGGMSLDEYADASQISSYAVTAMQWANSEGLITGVTDTTLEPKGSATRAQVATILMRFCENITA